MKFSPFHTGMEAPQDVFALRRRVNDHRGVERVKVGESGTEWIEWSAVDQSGLEWVRLG